MWASKVKNLLIAFGVSVSLVSLVLMLAFGSGLTDYISGLAENYTDPNFVTITKLYEHERDANGDMGDKANIMKPLPLSADEIENLTGENGLINSYLKDKNIDFAVSNENISYGFNMMTYPTGITIKFPINEKGIYDENGEKFKTDQVVYIYTTPPYYDDHNMLAGNISGKNEVMLSKALAKTLGITDYDDIVGKVKLNTLLSFTVDKETTNLDTKDAISDKLTGDPVVSGIVDVTDLLQTMLVMYVDYGYLQDLIDFANAKNSTHLELPTYSIYIETGNEKITNEIKSFINKTDIYTATTVEEQMASMFKGMISVFSTALAVIAGISLIVAAIMILVSLYMSVTERTREIGVLKSIGARRKDIKRIFTSESFLVGVLSGVVGILLALVAYFVLYVVLGSLLGVAPLSLRWWYFALAIGISILISMISGLLPAAKAAKLDPVESLRHE